MALKKTNKHTSIPLVALVGYTNAGKSALTNMITGSKLSSKDQLF